VRDHARDRVDDNTFTMVDVLDQLSTAGSTWSRADVVRVVCDLAPARASTAQRWVGAVERVADRVLDACVNLDPTDTRVRRRAGDGRSVWIEPVAGQYTSERILAEEEAILTWAIDRQAPEPDPSATVDVVGLDVAQAGAARAVAGRDGLVIVEGPAGAGKTTMLQAAIDDLNAHGRTVLGLAPTAKAARVLESETRMAADTIAKLLHEHTRTDRAQLDRYRPPAGATLIVDEAGLTGTPTLHQLTRLADEHGWRVVLVGDPRQLQAVGRGGLFAELCRTGRVHELATIHRFTHPWEAAASLQLRHGNPSAFGAYDDHGRIRAGTIDEHLDRLAHAWAREHTRGRTMAITATSNDHVDAINHAVQAHRLDSGAFDPATGRAIAGGEVAHVGDIVVTRRNDRSLTTSTSDHGQVSRGGVRGVGCDGLLVSLC
jgi:ATP-dependent exoDNAse (exonuclease V) alpha subunit